MAVPCAAATAAGRFTKGGQITISACDAFATKGAKASKKAAVSAAVLYIFQLPARTGLRMSLQNSNLCPPPRIFVPARRRQANSVSYGSRLSQAELAKFFDQLKVGAQSRDGFTALLDAGLLDDTQLVGRFLQVSHARRVDAHDAAAGGIHRRQVRAHHQHARLLASPLYGAVAFHAH